MTEYALPTPPQSEAILFEFDRSRVTLSEKQADAVFKDSPLGHWANTRVEKYSELVEPYLMYVSGDFSHHVAWVKHKGVSGDPEEAGTINNYHTFHVVCDCAAGDENSALPSSIAYCDYTDDVIVQRAYELSREHRLAEILGAFTVFDEETLSHRLKPAGQELAARAITHILEIDQRNPGSWVANRMTGMHDISVLSLLTSVPRDELKDVAELLESGGIVEIDNDSIKLTPEQVKRRACDTGF